MADYTLNLTNISEVQAEAATDAMNEANAVRTANGDTPFANVNEFMEDWIKNGPIKDWTAIYEQKMERQENLKEAFAVADTATRDQVRALLAPFIP